LGRKTRQGKIVAAIIGLIVIATFVLVFSHSAKPGVRVGSVALILFAACMEIGLMTWGSPAKGDSAGKPECAYREGLSDQYRFLVILLYGYAGLVLPGCVLLLYGTHVYEFVAFIYLLLVGELLLRETKRSQRELHGLDQVMLHGVQGG